MQMPSQTSTFVNKNHRYLQILSGFLNNKSGKKKMVRWRFSKCKTISTILVRFSLGKVFRITDFSEQTLVFLSSVA